MLAGCQGHDVQPAKFFQGIPDEFFTKGFIAEVSRQQDGLPALLSDEFRHFFGIALFFRKVVQGYVGSFACVGNSRRPAYSRVSPCDQGFSSTEPVAAMVALFPGIRHGFHFGLQAGGFLLLLFISFLAEFAARVLYFVSAFCAHFFVSHILMRS